MTTPAAHLPAAPSSVPYSEGTARLESQRRAELAQIRPSALTVTVPTTQAELERLPEALSLYSELALCVAQTSAAGNSRWHYEATTALKECLPQTIALYGKRLGHGQDPEFQQALKLIRDIAVVPYQGQQGNDWEAHLTMLRNRAQEEQPRALRLPE